MVNLNLNKRSARKGYSYLICPIWRRSKCNGRVSSLLLSQTQRANSSKELEFKYSLCVCGPCALKWALIALIALIVSHHICLHSQNVTWNHDKGDCLSILGLLGTLGIGALARALALFSIWRVANSRLATWEVIMVKAVWSRPFLVYLQKTSNRLSSFDCLLRDLVRL